MKRIPLRIKFSALLLLGVMVVGAAVLLVVQRTLNRQNRTALAQDLKNSVVTFHAFQMERERSLGRSAELLAGLPTVRALMTTRDMKTIQDGSREIWRISGKDLLVLSMPSGKIMGVQSASSEITSAAVEESLQRSLGQLSDKQWWFVGGHLYEVSFQPIYFGPSRDNRVLGVLALGSEINERVAQEISQIADSQVVFQFGATVVASTVPADRQGDLKRAFQVADQTAGSYDQEVYLGKERYFATCVDLTPGALPGAKLSVLKSYDEAAARFRGLYRALAGLGVLALLGQCLVAFAIFRRYTTPLEHLVEGVRALGKGDFTYPLHMRGNDELAEATASFIRMRDDLQHTQRQLLEAERLATIGRMASSISHDLRHQLTAIVANSEFLAERNLDQQQSEELYQEIRDAVGRMTELIDSLLEFSKPRRSLSPSYGSLEEALQRAIRSVQRHPIVHSVNISLSCHGSSQGWFDPGRMERVFCNVLLNACQAVPPDSGRVAVLMQELPQGVEVTISDNGAGIPAPVRDKIFEPFVSYGKENGTGLGLTIAHKILEEHGGTITLQDSSPAGTTFLLSVPFASGPDMDAHDEVPAVSSMNTVSRK
ncbi:MAG TPA: HAMP domain-containing sensor histidine kinase [Candidatus Saccharimonadales bacterium]|jgi:signal transduction histidine kinase|nr:HAMP domain-containing sensor histidine kinase [Candidatus Saccharimonadales bacterium]